MHSESCTTLLQLYTFPKLSYSSLNGVQLSGTLHTSYMIAGFEIEFSTVIIRYAVKTGYPVTLVFFYS